MNKYNWLYTIYTMKNNFVELKIITKLLQTELLKEKRWQPTLKNSKEEQKQCYVLLQLEEITQHLDNSNTRARMHYITMS